MLTSDEVIDKIRLIVRSRRVRLTEFFLSFDSKGKKQCTPAQFRRALDMSGVTREMEMARGSEEELYGLMDRYRSKSDPGKAFRRRPTAGRPPAAGFGRAPLGKVGFFRVRRPRGGGGATVPLFSCVGEIRGLL